MIHSIFNIIAILDVLQYTIILTSVFYGWNITILIYAG